MTDFIFKLNMIFEIRFLYPTSLFKRRFQWRSMPFLRIFRIERFFVLSNISHFMCILYRIYLMISSISF